MRPILVTGGTGTLGRVVVGGLVEAGREVRVVSRQPRPGGGSAAVTSLAVDLRGGGAGSGGGGGAGVDAAVAGVDTIIHCATSPRGDVELSRHLAEAARRAGVGHLVYISIVGVDRVPLGYYRAKLAVERLVEASGLGWTILRTTQFHDLVLRLFGLAARLPVMLVPGGVSVQPVDVREVAARLVELALGPPAGRVPDMGGPQVRAAADLARAYLRASGRRRLVLPVRLPGATFAAYRAGGHLTPDHAAGRTTFEEFLEARTA
ncbi:MAG TPA: NAD(P)H-binding protein [Mycobacteriales bacterium]|nr:NAD(P)H-binding protein [Mycobacteriales bacterium]